MYVIFRWGLLEYSTNEVFCLSHCSMTLKPAWLLWMWKRKRTTASMTWPRWPTTWRRMYVTFYLYIDIAYGVVHRLTLSFLQISPHAGEGAPHVQGPGEVWADCWQPEAGDGEHPGVLCGWGGPHVHHEEPVWWHHRRHRCGGAGRHCWPAGPGESTCPPTCRLFSLNAVYWFSLIRAFSLSPNFLFVCVYSSLPRWERASGTTKLRWDELPVTLFLNVSLCESELFAPQNCHFNSLFLSLIFIFCIFFIQF